MLTSLLSSDPKSVSAMRAMSFISLFCGIGLAFYGLYTNKDLTGLTMLVSVFVGSAFGGKIWQKSIEAKSEAKDVEVQKPDGTP
jgi:hypothetical protein